MEVNETRQMQGPWVLGGDTLINPKVSLLVYKFYDFFLFTNCYKNKFATRL